MLTPEQRSLFDRFLEETIADLPEPLQQKLEELPVIVEDEPSSHLMAELKLNPRRTDLCGLHSGIPLTRRSVEHSGALPDQIRLFREPIGRVSLQAARLSGAMTPGSGEKFLRQQIRITLLHEIGHHFGLDEEDLRRLGYG